EAIVDTGPDVAADLRPPFRPARLVREVGGDVSGRYVCVLADLSVADVGEVRHLRSGAELRVLDLHERPDLCARPQLRARTQVTERPHPRTRPDLGVDCDRMRPDLRTRCNARLAAQDGERMDRRVGLELDLRLDPCCL